MTEFINERLIRKLRKFQFSENYTNKIIDFTENIFLEDLYCKNRTELKEKMEKDYYRKSESMLRYFLTNISQSFNNRTKEQYGNNYNRGFFSYQENFKYNENFELIIQEAVKGKYLSQQDGLMAQKRFSKVKYIEYMNDIRERPIKKFFITFTLDTIHHKYTQKHNKNPNLSKYSDNNFILNENYKYYKLENEKPFEEVTEENLKLLNEIHRYFTEILRIYIVNYIKEKYSLTSKEIRESEEFSLMTTVDKIKMLEPHASLTPHYHGLFFIDEELEEVFNKVYELTLKHFNLNKEYCPKEDIQDAKASTYVAKYIIKNLSNDYDEEQKESNLKIDIVNQYMRYFSNVRFFNTSNFRHSTQSEIDVAYSYLKKNNPKYLEELKQNGKPLYVSLEELIKEDIFIFKYEKKEAISVDFDTLKEDLTELFQNKIEEKEEELINIEKNINNISIDNILKINKEELSGLNQYYFNQITSYPLRFKKSYSEDIFQTSLEKINKISKEYYINQSSILESDIELLKSQMKQYILMNIDKYIKEIEVKTFKSAHLLTDMSIYSNIDEIEKECSSNYEIIKTNEDFVHNKVDESYFETYMHTFENEEWEEFYLNMAS